MTADEARVLRMVECVELPWEADFVNVAHCVVCRGIVVFECPSLTVATYLCDTHNAALTRRIAAEKRKARKINASNSRTS